MKNDFLRFFKTNQHCEIDNVSYAGIPVFFSNEGIMENASDYMIYLRYKERTPQSTTETYAYHIQKFLKHIRHIAIPFDEVTDSTLIAWRDSLIDKDGLDTSTIATYLRTVFSYYVWAEETSRLQYSVAIYNISDTEENDYQDRVFKISAVKNPGNRSWSWPYTPTAGHKPNRNTPTNKQLEKVHSAAFEKKTGARDSLILSFYEDVRTRKAETMRLTIRDIPSWDKIEDFIDNDKVFTLNILGKGNKYRYVPVLPDLMARTRDYIENERAEVIRKIKKRNSAYNPPDDLFIGHSTGESLNPQYLSRHISALMKKAGIENASGHRVRASGLTTLAQSYDGVDQTGKPLPVEQILMKVADIAGHASIESLRPYLNFARSPAPNSGSAMPIDNTLRLHELHRRIEAKSVEFKDIDKLADIAKALRHGKRDEAQNLLQKMLEMMSV